MTEIELQSWGKREHETRLDDMARVRAGTLSINGAQEAAKIRSKRAGLSASETDRALRFARVARS